MTCVAEVPCAIDGCEKRVIARGWCWMHYGRWRRHGNPRAFIPHSERVKPAWVDPLTEEDYAALRGSVDADARKLLPFVAYAIIFKRLGLEG